MFKKSALFFSLSLSLSLTPAFAEWEEFDERDNGTVRAIWKNPDGSKIHLESAAENTKDAYKEVILGRKLTEGYPTADKVDTAFKNQNLDRQNAGNRFHLYTLSLQFKDETTQLGFVQFGRMPSINYPEGPNTENPIAHHDIIQKFMKLGITQQKEDDGGFAKENIERKDERGIAFILPVLKEEYEASHNAAIGACYELVCKLTMSKNRLPVENTIPYVAMSMFSPNDPMVEKYMENKFDFDSNPGFGWFYPKEGKPNPRVVMTRPLDLE